MVNGPEDLPDMGLDGVEWDRIDWKACEREVRHCGSGSSRRRGKRAGRRSEIVTVHP
jgi:hypothetical protein